jgi:hypothetical protein
LRADFLAESFFTGFVLVVFSDGEDIGLDAAEVVLEVEAEGLVFSDDRVVDNGEVAKEFEFVFLGEGGASFFVVPEDIIGGEANGEVVAKSAGLAEELDVTCVDDVVAAGYKNLFHWVMELSSFMFPLKAEGVEESFGENGVPY